MSDSDLEIQTRQIFLDSQFTEYRQLMLQHIVLVDHLTVEELQRNAELKSHELIGIYYGHIYPATCEKCKYSRFAPVN